MAENVTFDPSSLQPNSFKSKEQQAKKSDSQLPTPRVAKVAAGKIKAKSAGRKLVDTFIEDDMSTVKSYIRDDILVPTIKETIVDLIEGTVELLLGTGKGGRRRHNYSSSSQTTDKVSYYSYHKSDSDRRERKVAEKKKDSGVRDYEDIILETRADAESVLRTLESAIREYGAATVGDLYDAVGITNTEFTTQEWGWKNLDICRVKPTRGGWIIDLPEPEFLD